MRMKRWPKRLHWFVVGVTAVAALAMFQYAYQY